VGGKVGVRVIGTGAAAVGVGVSLWAEEGAGC